MCLPSLHEGIIHLTSITTTSRPLGRAMISFGHVQASADGPSVGGQLLVRHHGSNVKYDWSSNNSDLQWAAFYSDCEHEVLEVTAGHRVTLTYNLYDRNDGSNQPSLSCMRPSQLPLYDHVQHIIGEPDFLHDG